MEGLLDGHRHAVRGHRRRHRRLRRHPRSCLPRDWSIGILGRARCSFGGNLRAPMRRSPGSEPPAGADANRCDRDASWRSSRPTTSWSRPRAWPPARCSSYRERHGQPHDRDFLTVGSMGHSSQIALGHRPASARSSVFCLDGDGAVLMHLGSLAIIGTQAPPNLRHVVINNGAHDSVGGQPTADARGRPPGAGPSMRVSNRRSGGDSSARSRPPSRACGREPGPSLLEIRVASRASTDAGRPTTSPDPEQGARSCRPSAMPEV